MRRLAHLSFAALLAVVGLFLVSSPPLAASAVVHGGSYPIPAARPICLAGDPRCPPPDVTFAPSGGTFSTASQTITVDWCGHATLMAATRQITLNGVNVTSSFSYTTSAKTGCTSHATSTGTVTLATGSNTVTGYIEDNISQAGSNSASYTLSAPPAGPIVDLTPHNGTNRNVALCMANCFDEVLTYSTPAYRSLDQDRSLTLMYRSSQASPVATVTVDVRDTAALTVDHLSIKLLDPNGALVPLLNGPSERPFQNQAGVTLRISAQFSATGVATGAYTYTAIVTSYYTSGAVRSTSKAVRVLIVNETYSTYGAGWSVVGIGKVIPTTDGGVAVTDGSGSIQYFAGPCVLAPCNYGSPAGEFSTMSRTASGWGRRYPDGTTIMFDASGYQTSSQDRFANTTSYAYSSGRLSSITDPVGQVISVSPASGSYAITVPAGRVSTVTLDGSGRVASIQDPVGGYPLSGMLFDGSGVRLTQWTDRRGGVWNVAYDCSYHVATTMAPTIIADGVSKRPLTQSAHVDAQTSACALTLPASAVAAANSSAWTRDARNVPTTYFVDPFFAPTRIIDSLGRVTIITRDTASRVTRVQTPSGHIVASTWTGANLTRTVDSTTGRAINYTYDTRYNLLTSVSGHTPSVVNYLNAAGSLIDSTKVAGAAATKIKYDARGRDTLTIDPEGHTTRRTFGAAVWDNASSVEIGVGHKTTYSYDNAGRLELTVDALSNTARTTYDALNRPRWTVGPRGDSTFFAYDSLYLWKVTDAVHQVYQYDRNALGWVETARDPALRTTTNAYDANGNLTATTNRRGQTVTSSYDALGRPSQLGVDPQRTTTFSYDPADRWLTASNGTSLDTIKLDVAGRRMVEIARRLGQRLVDSSEYDDTLDVRVAVTQPNLGYSGFVRLGYDASYQLSSLLTGGWYTNIGSNADRNASTLGFPSGVTQANSYSADHSKSLVSFTPAGSAVDQAFQVGTHEDSLGRVTTRFHYADTSRVYSYDQAGQLTGYYDQILGGRSCHKDPDQGIVCGYFNQTFLPGESYSYDLVGNRTDGGVSIDPGNRVRAFQGFTLTYDADGNLVRKVKAGVADDSLEWNALGELTRVWRSGIVVAEFTYDGFGRRVTKTASGVVTNYQWDDDHVVAELDGAGNAIARYAFYPGVDKPHSVTTSAGTFVMATETPGNVIGLMPYTSNSVSAQYSYKPFGAMERNDQTVTNSLRFQARPYDPETGYYYFRARYYDPTISRFISEDPAGLAAGMNPYTFESNNPVNSSDPYGLDDGDCRVSDKSACQIDGVTITDTNDGRENGWARNPSDRGGRPWANGPAGLGAGGGPGTRPLTKAEKDAVFRAIRNLLRRPMCRQAGLAAYNYYPERMTTREADQNGFGYVGGDYDPKTDRMSFTDLAFHPEWYAVNSSLQEIVAHEAGHTYLRLSPSQLTKHMMGVRGDTVYNLGAACK